jgi:glycosyltransferase involved in cell wall biosynthesis
VNPEREPADHDAAAVEPLVSIVIPTYNRLGYLREAVASVQGQTFERWELTVVDDGSTDGTGDYLSSLGDRRIRLERHEHCGNPARLRNVGVARSRGSHIAFLDSDDLWEPLKLQLQLAAMAESGCRWSHAGFDMVDASGRPVPFIAGGPWQPYSGDIVAPLLTTEAAVAISSLVVERGLVGEVGGFDESQRLLFREDYEFSLRLSLAGRTIAVPGPLCHVRHHPGRATLGRQDLYQRSADAYRKVELLLPDARLRKLCRHRCALHLVADADARRADGARGPAWRQLAKAFRYRPGYGRWWIVLVKLLLRR